MDRRTFVATLAGGLLAAPLAAWAQPTGKIPRIGRLSPATPAADSFMSTFRQALRDLGWIEGQNIAIEYRFAEGRLDRLPELAAELVRLNVDLIFAGGTAASLAARGATTTIPIVFVGVADPVGAGLVTSLARPGANVTGLSDAVVELAPKLLQLLREVSRDKVSRVGVVFDPEDASEVLQLRALDGPARALGITLRPVEVKSQDDFADAFSRMVSGRVDAIHVAGGPLTNTHVKQVAQLAARTRLPAIYARRAFVEAGGLMSYAFDILDQYRRAATFVDKILKGAKPADLAIELPTKFELVLNLKTARALGLTIPPSLLLRADEVIQ